MVIASLIVASAGSVAGGFVFFGAVAAMAATLVRAALRWRRTPAVSAPARSDGRRRSLRTLGFLAGWFWKD